MTANFNASAPHIHVVSRWNGEMTDWGGHLEPIDGRSMNCGRLLWKGEDGLPEAGLWICTLPRDELCHFVAGRAVYRADDGEVIEVGPGTVAHFREDWTGTVEVFETIRSVYMLR
jgi:hypothetical protein